MSKKRVIILSTGGTIVSKTQNALSSVYESGDVDISDLISEDANVTVQCEVISYVSSQDMNAVIWSQLHERIKQIMSRNEADGIVISHGTDTLEESAFVLELTLNLTCPIVFVGAMRTANTLGSDGERALANAIQVAAHPDSKGVIAISGDRILLGRTIYKCRTDGIDGFSSYPLSQLGVVTPKQVDYFIQPEYVIFQGSFLLPDCDRWPVVPIIYISANMDKSILALLEYKGLQGVIIAGVGHGNAPKWLIEKLQHLSSNGKYVVRSTRLDTGHVYRNLEVDDDGLNFIVCRSLSPQKSQILVQPMLSVGIIDSVKQQEYFNLF